MPIFAKFQNEFKKGIPTILTDLRQVLDTTIVEVIPHSEIFQRSTVQITKNEGGVKISCRCCLFEEYGWLCFHCIAVLMNKQVREIPDAYILKRWTRDLKTHVFDVIREKKSTVPNAPECIGWRHQMCRHYVDLIMKAEGNERARKVVEDSYNRDFAIIEDIVKKPAEEVAVERIRTRSQIVRNPVHIKTKGRSKKRVKGHFEKKRSSKRQATEVSTIVRKETVI